jgi:hypothetical protein
MYSQLLSGPVTETQTTQSYKPGELVVTNDKTYGTRVWRYIKNTEASTAFAVGTIVQRAASTIDDMSGIVCVTAKKSRFSLLGVAQNAIAAGSFGFILKEGIGYVVADGSVTAGSTVCSTATSGRATNATLTNADEVAAAFGVALEDDGVAGTTFRGHVSFP